jgi:excinuclease ABC subunit B
MDKAATGEYNISQSNERSVGRDEMPDFKLISDFKPMGDQPDAIRDLVAGLKAGHRHQTLLGATGTGKTYVMASLVEACNRPTLVMAHNKTLAAQLYSEFREFFPHNSVEYFVSYYDYYQPEAYLPRTDTYIEKDSMINDEIERLRLAATSSLLSRRDVLIVASVSCIYGLGDPSEYGKVTVRLKVGETVRREQVLRELVDIFYERNDLELRRGKFRVRGDTLELVPAYSDLAYRIEFFGDELERITEIDPVTGEVTRRLEEVEVFPARHFVTPQEKLTQGLELIQGELEAQLKLFREEGKLLETQRLEQRTRYDIEMLREVGFCSGIENYSRPLSLRPPGSRPWTLLDYFPPDWLLIVDESHMTIPQIHGMYNGDRARKQVLVDYGFRLPSALDNRPLKFEEWESTVHQVLYTSATPGPYELTNSQQVVEQIIRPTGLVDPVVEIRPTRGQVDDLLAEIRKRTANGERVLVTTLTKRMAEDLADYLQEVGVKVHYLHSEVQTIERIEILRDLRLGIYDVVVGINLLREGLDLPEVSLVAILDADKEGFLRSEQALIQTIGRAARHVHGKAIMYADALTDSMRRAIDETNRRRGKQEAYNQAHGIVPTSIVKSVRDLTQRVQTERSPGGQGVALAEDAGVYRTAPTALPKDEAARLIKDLERQMKAAAQALEFEKAALLRDQIIELRRSAQAQDSRPIWEQLRDPSLSGAE